MLKDSRLLKAHGIHQPLPRTLTIPNEVVRCRSCGESRPGDVYVLLSVFGIQTRSCVHKGAYLVSRGRYLVVHADESGKLGIVPLVAEVDAMITLITISEKKSYSIAGIYLSFQLHDFIYYAM